MSLTFAPRPHFKSSATTPGTALPQSELSETPDGFELFVEMPGVTRENLGVTIENGLLRITGKREGTPPGTPVLRELSQGDFAREFRLGSTIDTGRISAVLEQGLLRLTLPKLPQSQLRRIPLQEA